MLPSRRSREVKHTVDDCSDWNGLQRHEQRIFVWIAGAQDADPWEHNIAPKQGLVPHSGSCLFARVELLANDPQE